VNNEGTITTLIVDISHQAFMICLYCTKIRDIYFQAETDQNEPISRFW